MLANTNHDSVLHMARGGGAGGGAGANVLDSLSFLDLDAFHHGVTIVHNMQVLSAFLVLLLLLFCSWSSIQGHKKMGEHKKAAQRTPVEHSIRNEGNSKSTKNEMRTLLFFQSRMR